MNPKDPVCSVCGKTSRSNAKLHQCQRCTQFYHTACRSSNPVLDTNSLLIKVCNKCIVEANPNAAHRALASANASSRPTSPAGTSRSHSQSSRKPDNASITDSTSVLILARLTAMEEKFDAKLLAMDEKLEPIKLIPQIVARVEATGKEVSDLKANQESMQQEIENLKVARDQQVSPECVARVEKLEQANERLRTKVKELSASQNNEYDNLVIGGVSWPLPTHVDLKKLSLAILKVIDPELVPHDILSAKISPLRAPSLPQPQPTASAHDEATSAAVSQGHSGSGVTPRILVSLHLSSLVKSSIQKKIQHGKLHSSSISDSELSEAGMVPPVQNSLINITEFLPADVYRLRREVFKKAKEAPRFIAFIGKGQIYVKRSNRDAPILISSIDDL